MASSSGDAVASVPTMSASQPRHQSMDWTQLPEGCRMLLVTHMDDATRTAWRATCSLTRHDVHASTRTLTWRSETLSDQRRRRLITTLPAALIASLANLRNLVCSNMTKLTSIQGIPTSLQSLDLTSCYSLNSLAPLLDCTALRELALGVRQWEGQAAVLPQVMAALSSGLRKLRLSVSAASQAAADSRVADEVMRSLEPLTGLQELAVLLDPVSETACHTLARTVGQTPGLRVLHLSDETDDLSDETDHTRGFDCLSMFATALRQLSQLQSLTLIGNRSEEDSLVAVAEALTSLPATLTHLNTGRIVISADDAVALAAVLQAHSATLRTITLADSLEDYGTDIWTLLAPGLRACSSLTELNLRCCEINMFDGAALATALAGCATSLTSLDLSGNHQGDNIITALARVLSLMTALVKLDLYSSWLSPVGVVALAPALSSIGPSLTFLDISYNDIKCDGAVALAPALRSMSALVRFDCASCSVGPTGAMALAAALPSMTRLRHFDLSDNEIGLRGFAALAGGLQALPGGQHWRLSLDDELVQHGGVLCPCDDSKAIVTIIDNVDCVRSWKAEAADIMFKPDSILEPNSRTDRADRKLLGLQVTF